MLDPGIQAEILRLFYSDRLSKRKIASRLNIHRKTVDTITKRSQVHVNHQSRPSRSSMLGPYHAQIQTLLRDDPSRSAVNILQILRTSNYQGGLTILKDHLRQSRLKPEPKAYLSLEFLPAQAAQVDWGDFGNPFGLGRKLWCFVMVMCHSRLMYIEFTLSANLESFLRCHENAFTFFGGIPKEIWYDNLATAVAERKGKIVRFNPKFLAYVGHCRFKPIACNLAAGWEKGRVEDGVRYVRYNFWPGRLCKDRDDTNAQSIVWRNTFANKRTHAATHKVPELHFLQEKPHLLPLPEPYDTDEKKSVNISHQFRARFDSNEYSVPWRLSGRTLTLRADEKTVRFYLGRRRITCHARSWNKGDRVVNSNHNDGLLENKPGAQTSSDIAAVKALGSHGERYLQFLGAQHRSIQKELKTLMVLITVYGPEAVELCIGEALGAGIIGSDHLERLLIKSQSPESMKPAPLSLSDERLMIPPHIPNLKSYDSLLFDHEPNNKEMDNDTAGTENSI